MQSVFLCGLPLLPSRFTFSAGLHMNINKSNKMLVSLLHLQDLFQVLPPLGTQGGQVTFLLGQWELSGWQLGFHHLQFLFHLLHGDEQVLHLTHDRFNYGPRFLFSFSSHFFIYALALREHSAAPLPFKRYAVIFLFLHELLHWKTSNESFFFPVFSFLSLCCFSFSSLTYILSLTSLDVYQFVTLMSVRSTGRGHPVSHGVTTIWPFHHTGANIPRPAHTNTAAQRHTHSLELSSSSPFHLYAPHFPGVLK